ncbi:MAG: methyltransferase domain-containing protein [Dyadobacter sp.]|uniref:class I SAM-dependent methyltransferase n=1 Tax=Dyadobacter sp. TaxID=1914288 RepID=UPI003265E012
MNTNLQFNGQIPQQYQDVLTPFLFDGFSQDLISRIDFTNVSNVLELASGTGSVTKYLLEHLPMDAHLIVTDLEADMLDIARQKVYSPNLSYNVVDMTQIPYIDEQFDLIICQFGLMLVADKQKALSEMYRVLKKGGRLAFSVWGDIEANPVWDISGKVIANFLGANPMLQDPGPFSLADEGRALKLLENAGFGNSKVHRVSQLGSIETAVMAADGFIEGLPVFMAISKKDPALVQVIKQALAPQLSAALGDRPTLSPLQAWVFETTK